MFIEDFDSLKLWLTESLAPICDADPDALAKYVLALMKKNKSEEELHRVCLQQLDVFLQEHTKAFVSTLFDVIASGKYVRSDHSSSLNDKEVIASLQKNSNQNKDCERRQSNRGSPALKRYRSSSPPLKDPHLNGNDVGRRYLPQDIAADVSLNPNPVVNKIENDLFSNNNFPSAVDRDYRKKARCRDFHEKGFCMRGELCSFDHGSDPVVVENLSLSKVMGYPVTNQVPLLHAPYTTPHSIPVSRTQSFVDPITSRNYNAVPASQRTVLTVPIVDDEAGVNHSEDSGPKPKVEMSQQASQLSCSTIRNNQQKGQDVSSHRFGGHSKPRGNVGKRFDPQNCTLFVTRIPHALNNVGKLYEQFSKFGNIANVQVNPSKEMDTALVTFSSHQEALAAYRSPEPIFSNRFVRLFFYDHTRSAASQHQQHGSTAGAINNQRSKPSGDVHRTSVPKTEEPPPLAKSIVENSSSSHNSAHNSTVKSSTEESNSKADQLDSSDGETDEAANDSVRRRPRPRLLSSQKDEEDEKSLTTKSKSIDDRFSQQQQQQQHLSSRNNVRQAAHQSQQQQRLKKELHVKQLSLLQGYRKQLMALVMKLEKATSIVDKRRIAAAVKNVNSKIGELEQELNVNSKSSSASSTSVLQRQLLDLEMEIHQKELSNECVAALKARLLQLKRTINAPTNALSRRRLSSNSNLASTAAVPLRLPMGSQTRLDKRPRTLYITGHDEDQYDVLMTEFAVSGLRITTYKQVVMEGTPVAIVTFGSRAEAEQALTQFQIFQGRTLKLEWTRPKLESALDGSSVVDSNDLDYEGAYVCDDANNSVNQKTSTLFSELDTLVPLSSSS